jgi:ribosome-associated protein
VKLDKEASPITTKIKAEKTLTKQSAFKKTKNKKAKTDNQQQAAQVNDTPRSKRKPISF